MAVGCAGRRVMTVALLEADAVGEVVGVFTAGGLADAGALLEAVPRSGADDDAIPATVLVAVTVTLLVAVHEANISSEIPIARRRMTQRSPISTHGRIRLGCPRPGA